VTVLQANYFDGRTTRLRVVDLSVSGAELTVSGDDIDLHLPFSAVGVDERLGRAPRRLRFPGGAFCEVRDLDALDALLKSMAYRDGWVDRMQRHVQAVIISTVVSILLSLAAYKWGLPWVAAEGARRMPPAVGRTLSVQALKVLDGKFLLTSKIPRIRQQALSAEFNRLRLPEDGTLPDGTIILLDDLVTSIDDDRQIMAVLSHELGHAHGHDSLQLLLESSAVGAFWTFYAGDISSLIAAAPAVLVKARYSQSLERTADEYGAALLARNDMSPRLLADALETVAKSRALPGSASVGYLSSHPSTDERLKRLRELAAAFEAK
jgi:Zn-dependent protease with chaperone function